MLCQINDLTYELANKTLFRIKDLSIHAGDRIGLIGRNGSGKSTLLKIIADELEPTEGKITKYGTTAYLPQLKPKKGYLSGGEITQEWIRRIFSEDKDLLLLDEPTTHLDQPNIEKLEEELKKAHHTFVIVSHDREFLDQLCTTIWEMDEEKIIEYKGNYSEYEHQKHQRIQHHEKEYEKYVEKKKQLEDALRMKEQKAKRATKKPKNVSKSEAKITGAKPYFAKKQKKLNQGAKAIQTRIDQLEKVEKIKELPPIQMKLAAAIPAANKPLIRCHELDGQIGDKTLWSSPASFTIENGEKIGIIGPNGSGKTTLIHKLLNDEKVQRSPQLKVGYFSQQLEQLNVKKTILENVQATSSQDETLIRTVLARLGFRGDSVYKEVNVLSGGERVKVALAKIFVSDVNTLILDEPTNFLDIEALEALEKLLQEYPGTLLFVSHDRRFVEHVAEKLIIIHDRKLYIHDGPEIEFWESQEQANSDEELLLVETQITEILSRMSLDPNEELEAEFERLLQKKKELDS
ncbi:ribosomal protection-like ABC-F family protein [Piscibacillus halophilus]|uniref:Pleuromutilin/lincosamide/streptogramin A transport system ATP-binding/permease protein n=1 Tax=Piscibacillus halophilus TaxID=571933 RepID=A0A1H9DHY8_9BACI|nr:ABC-F type ribosomal protection protein [Piscibacillus halophilus]SEQ13110.1 pleuromutilin/lincosamide/streptogramin A transport system ATP-binding/permease protein [Piscibacillus halophilus]